PLVIGVAEHETGSELRQSFFNIGLIGVGEQVASQAGEAGVRGGCGPAARRLGSGTFLGILLIGLDLPRGRHKRAPQSGCRIAVTIAGGRREWKSGCAQRVPYCSLSKEGAAAR